MADQDSVFDGADIKALEKRMEGALDALRRDLAGLRTGRASPALLEPVTVEAYGATVPLAQVAGVVAPDSRMLSVTVWDAGLARAVERAIRDAGLGLNPVAEGAVIRVPIPELNQERRAELTRVAGRYAESARVAVRNVRRDGMDALKKAEKDGALGRDDARRLHDRVQKITDERVGQVDAALAQKENEIMSI